MDYPRWRRQGLPTTSGLAESLVGQFNARVKGKEKFWNRPGGAEAILQVRAALLSEDGRLERHFASRPGSPGSRQWTFKAEQAGQAALELQSRRNWEHLPSKEVFQCNVLVDNPPA